MLIKSCSSPQCAIDRHVNRRLFRSRSGLQVSGPKKRLFIRLILFSKDLFGTSPEMGLYYILRAFDYDKSS